MKYSAKTRGFFDEVYEVVKLIPTGRITTYGAIARYLGSGKSARIVGWAMNSSPKDVPAHRVVNQLGQLTGRNHFEDPFYMQSKLQEEGISVENHTIRGFELYFWDPNSELEIE